MSSTQLRVVKSAQVRTRGSLLRCCSLDQSRSPAAGPAAGSSSPGGQTGAAGEGGRTAAGVDAAAMTASTTGSGEGADVAAWLSTTSAPSTPSLKKGSFLY